MAGFIEQGENFAGSEVVLIDLDASRLELIRGLAARMAAAAGRRAHRLRDHGPARRPRRLRRGAHELPAGRLRGARARRAHPALPRRDRPGDPGPGRLLHGAALHPRDAGHPRRHGRRVPGRADLQLHEPGEHRRPGGRPTTATCRSCRCARARSSTRRRSPRRRGSTRRGWTSPASASTTAPGACGTPTTARTSRRCCARRGRAGRGDPGLTGEARRQLRLAAAMGAVPSGYFQYYYFERELLEELTAKPTTRAEDILGWVPGYWAHYEEQAAATSRSSIPAARAAASTSSSWRSTAWTPSTTTAARRCRSTCPTRGRCPASPTRSWSRRSACATPTASGRCPCPGCRRTCAASSARWRSTSRRRPTPRGRARAGRDARARRASARALARPGRAALRGDGGGAPRRSLPARLVPCS